MGIISVKLEDLVDGMVVAQDVFSNDVLLITRGTRFSKSIINRLKHDVYNHSNKTIPIYSDKVSIKNKPENNSKNLRFDEDVKARVLTSIDYIFTSEDNDKMTELATSVSDVLVEEITSTTYSAVCLDELKMCDNYTFNHYIDVASMGVMLSKGLNFSEKKLKEVGTAGILHDIGKRDIPLEILNKNGRLTEDEFLTIKKHPVYSYKRIKDTSLSNDIKLGVLRHHEKYCGGGYPLGIEGEHINLIARVLAVVDVYAVLVTKRAYKDAMQQSECIETMYGMSQQFDMDIFREFLKVLVVYPNGSTVSLSNNQKAKVVEQNKGYPLRPTISLSDGTIANLSTDLNFASTVII